MADPSAMLQRADTALREANSKKGGFGGFFSSVSKEDKYQEAIDLYIQAANALRTRQNYMQAGQAQEKAADVYCTKMGLEYGNDAATCFVDAAKAYSAANDYAAAVRCLESAIDEYTRKGNFRRAAGFKDQQGDHYLNKLHDIPHAVECFKQAAQWNMDENAPALANGIKLKVANLLASESLRQYAEAKQLFEDVAMFYAKDKMMSSSAKTPFFMALLCTLAIGDLVIVDRTLAQYKQSDPAFESQRECRLIEDLLEAMQDGNVPGFEDKLFSWNQVSRLDELKKTLLLDAKNKIVGAGAGGGAAEDGDDEFA